MHTWEDWMALLEVDGISVRRGRAEVLHDVSLSVSEGEVVALLGSNGVGKSTTLRTVSGLHRPYRGELRMGGSVISGLRPELVVRRGIAHVPEGRQIFAGLTVRENLEVAARVRGKLTRDDLDRVFDLFPPLEELITRRAGVMSGGQQQMLAIARGLMSNPSLLLLDEPSLGLAPKVVAQIGAIVRRLPSAGTAVLLVEQNAALALDVSDRGYLMASGTIVIEGKAAELREVDAIRDVYLGRGGVRSVE